MTFGDSNVVILNGNGDVKIMGSAYPGPFRRLISAPQETEEKLTGLATPEAIFLSYVRLLLPVKPPLKIF